METRKLGSEETKKDYSFVFIDQHKAFNQLASHKSFNNLSIKPLFFFFINKIFTQSTFIHKDIS